MLETLKCWAKSEFINIEYSPSKIETNRVLCDKRGKEVEIVFKEEAIFSLIVENESFVELFEENTQNIHYANSTIKVLTNVKDLDCVFSFKNVHYFQ